MVSDGRKFSSSWSFDVWIMTIILGIIVFIVVPYAIWNGLQAIETINDKTITHVLLAGLIPIIFMIATLFAPIGYTVTESSMIINRLGTNIIVPIAKIDRIRRITNKEIKFPIRICGVGGFCGSYGKFYNHKFGVFQAYITNRKTLIFIEYNNCKKILISPEKPEEFLDAVDQAKKQLLNKA